MLLEDRMVFNIVHGVFDLTGPILLYRQALVNALQRRPRHAKTFSERYKNNRALQASMCLKCTIRYQEYVSKNNAKRGGARKGGP